MFSKQSFDDLVYLLKCKNKIFNKIAVSETRVSKKTSLTSNVNLNNFFLKSSKTESTACGAMFYISNHLSYKPQIDHNMYKKSTRIYFH